MIKLLNVDGLISNAAYYNTVEMEGSKKGWPSSYFLTSNLCISVLQLQTPSSLYSFS